MTIYLHDFTDGSLISPEDERALWALRRQLLKQNIHRGALQLGPRYFELYVSRLGFTIAAINGVRNPHLREAA